MQFNLALLSGKAKLCRTNRENMSELTIAREQEIRTGYERVAAVIGSLHEKTREAVGIGAELGAHLKEAQKGHKDDAWTWLLSLIPHARKEVISFASRAYNYKQRNPELEDTSQLTFALCGATESAGDGQAPKAKQSDIAAFTVALMAVNARINKLKARPVSEWDDSVKTVIRDQAREQVRQLNALLEELA